MKPGNQNNNLGFILDRFSHSELRAWKEFSDDLNEYNIRLFFHLEAVRSLRHKDLCAALRDTKIISFKKDNWCRMVDFRFSNAPLSAKGSLISGGRFNIGNDLKGHGFTPFPALYIAESHDTAYEEKFGLPRTAKITPDLAGHEVALRKPGSYSFVNVNFELNDVFDLSLAIKLRKFVEIIGKFKMPDDIKALAKKLGYKHHLISEMTDLKKMLLDHNWRFYPMQFDIPSNPQLFGRFLRDAGFEAVIYPSTRVPNQKCVAVFTENLKGSDSFVSLADTPPDSVKYPTLNSETWNQLS